MGKVATFQIKLAWNMHNSLCRLKKSSVEPDRQTKTLINHIWRQNMNTLSFFNPRFTSDLFDVIDRNFCGMGADSFIDGPRGGYMPKVDVVEKKDDYVLDMELPGLSENDVDINLKDRVLTIAAKKEENAEKEPDEKKNHKDNKNFLIHERHGYYFSRSFTLPNDIDSDKVSAGFKNGLLTVTIPRKPETQVKRIAITA